MTSELPNTPLSAKITCLLVATTTPLCLWNRSVSWRNVSGQHPFNRLPSGKDVVEHLALAGVHALRASGRNPLLVNLLFPPCCLN